MALRSNRSALKTRSRQRAGAPSPGARSIGGFPSRKQSGVRCALVALASLFGAALLTATGAAHAAPSLLISHDYTGSAPVIVYGNGWTVPSDISVQVFDYSTGQLIASHTTRNPGTTCNSKGYCYTTSFKTSFSRDEIGSDRYRSCSWLRILAKSLTGPAIQAYTVYALPDCIV